MTSKREQELVAAIERIWQGIVETGTMQPENVGRFVFSNGPRAKTFKIAPADMDDDEALLGWLSYNTFKIICGAVAGLKPKAKPKLYVKQDPYEYRKPERKEFTSLSAFLAWAETDESEHVEWHCIVSCA